MRETGESKLKMICGILHVQKKCCWCKGLVWRDKRYAREEFVCWTCFHSNLAPTTNGGVRVIRAAKSMS